MNNPGELCGMCREALAATVPDGADRLCEGCQRLASDFETKQQELRAVLVSLPDDETLGAILRRRITLWLENSTDAELGAFTRLIRDGTATAIANEAEALNQRIQS